MTTIEEALTTGTGEWRTFSCPDHTDHSPSARVNVTTGKWVCMSCHSRGHQDQYEPPEHLVIRQAMNLTREQRKIPTPYLDMFDIDGPGIYWSDRFTQGACQHFRLGYDADLRQPVYPIRDEYGNVLGLVHRGGGSCKYKYPRGVKTSRLLFNIHEIVPGEPVVLVEGAPDVIALWEAGVSAVGVYGARLYPAQVELLMKREPSKVLVAFDMDIPGIKGAGAAVNDLMAAGIFAKRIAWSGYKDCGEMPTAVCRSLFQTG